MHLPFLCGMQINDRYEFPLQLDLDRDDGKYLSPDADRNVRNLYTLHRSVGYSHFLSSAQFHAFKDAHNMAE